MKPDSLLMAAVVGIGFMLAVGLAAGESLTAGSDAWKVVVGTLSFHGAILLGAMILLRMEGLGWGEAFGFRSGQSWRSVRTAAGVTVLFLPVALALSWASAGVMRYFLVEPEAQQAVQAVREAAGLTDVVLMGLMAVVVAPIAEEVLFRGLLYPALRPRWGGAFACLATSLMFGAVHFNVMSFVPLTLFAVVLVMLYEGTGTLLAPMTAHALFNGINFALLVLQP